ncbi:MAG: HEAT repeat domain-containing protein [Candidatus Methanoperedens sp.]|uniref:HEAT repeat domain-containing protein n=1 Tax=Candidatus Methanoperedens nitratireducens TaxID=1392998 RepID=UPI000693E22F|nr:HEAT repeat domain-containing protein [Candidatus Methanoperedens nitroreducens]MDJ1421473.1 HEAT repeat domain-containing protein [Candidatus Methanoperedens sp.]
MPSDHTGLREMKKSGDAEGLLRVLDTGDVKEIREAVRILGELRYSKATRPLIGLLETDDIQIRSNSAWALGEIGNARAVLPLIGLLNDPSENVQVYAAWALGRIGDKRAITALNAASKNGSQELRKHAREAIARIESNKRSMRNRDYDPEEYGAADEALSSDIDIPLVAIDVPLNILKCDYVSRAEGEPNRDRARLSKDVAIKDTVNTGKDNTRRIILGLKDDFCGVISIDVLFRYRDNRGDGHTSSVWLQVANAEESYATSGSDTARGRDFDLELDPEEQIDEMERRAPQQGVRDTKIKYSRKQIPRPVEESPDGAETKVKRIKTQTLNQTPDIDLKTQVVDAQKDIVDVDSAVRLLSDIGMAGMTNAASTVTQLAGQESESLQSQLRTLPIDQMRDEIAGLGDYIVSIEIKLHGKGQAGEVNGMLHLYFSKDVALAIANELLCNQADAAIKEFTEDIISTLKETANIFGGQYISAVSEYIEVPIFLEAPIFKTGTSVQIAESVMKDVTGKVEFALATDLALGSNKTGRLIMLLDPRSFEIIVAKLF